MLNFFCCLFVFALNFKKRFAEKKKYVNTGYCVNHDVISFLRIRDKQ